MPCTGPDYDQKKPKIITEDILKMLKEKHNIGNKGLDTPNDTFDFDDSLKIKLLAVVHEIVISNAFNGW